MSRADAAWHHAAELIGTMADGYEAMAAIGRALRSRPAVANVQVSLNPRRYLSGLVVEGFVDAELRDGTSLAWTLDLDVKEAGWEIDGAVRRYTALGNDQIAEFGLASGATLDALQLRFAEAISEMRRDADIRLGQP